MKKCFFGILFFGVLSMLTTTGAAAQEKFSASLGIGLPEMLNLGLRMQFEQSQVGLALGKAPGAEDENFAVSGDYYYHFGGKSKHTDLRPWFLKTGLTYMHNENEWERNTLVMLVPRVGREFNISPKFGIALEAGFLLLLIDNEVIKKPRENSWFDLDLDFSGVVLPSAGINLFYRI